MTMATVYRTTGALDGSDPGQSISLPMVETRLTQHQVVFIGDHPRGISPATTNFTHVVISVSPLDTKTEKFQKDGFYLVTGLHAERSAFLTAPEPVRTGLLAIQPWSTVEWVTVRATGTPDVFSISWDQQLLGEVSAVDHGMLVDNATKLYRKKRPEAP
jgi:hypothetical protein